MLSYWHCQHLYVTYKYHMHARCVLDATDVQFSKTCIFICVTDKDRRHLLCQTLIGIWELVATENFQVVLMKNHYINEGSENERLETVQTVGESSTQGFQHIILIYLQHKDTRFIARWFNGFTFFSIQFQYKFPGYHNIFFNLIGRRNPTLK